MADKAELKKLMGDKSGELVSWDCAGMTFQRSALADALESVGFDPKYARELHASDAFARAVRTLKKDRVIEPVPGEMTPEGIIRFQFTGKRLEELRETDQAFKYEFQVFLDLNVETGVIKPVFPGVDLSGNDEALALAAHAQAELKKAFTDRNGRDMNRLIQRLFKYEAKFLTGHEAHIFKLRSNGCFYFVAWSHTEFTDRIETFLNAAGATLDRVEVNSSKRTMRTITRAVEDGCIELVANHARSVAKFGVDTKKGILTRHLKELEESRQAIEMYREYLSAKADKLTGSLNDLAATLEKTLTDKEAALADDGPAPLVVEDDCDVTSSDEPVMPAVSESAEESEPVLATIGVSDEDDGPALLSLDD